MTTLVLGRAEDVVDYIRYCSERGRSLSFLQPPALPTVDELEWDDLLAEAGEAAAASNIEDVVSFHDGYQVHVELLRARWGWPTRDIEALRYLTDKELFKTHPAVADLTSPYVCLPSSVGTEDALTAIRGNLRFPVVVKPSRGFYSIGVVRADGADDFARALTSARRVCRLLESMRGPSKVLVEEYLDGPEYAVDGFVTNGEVIPLLFHRKEPRLAGPHFHEVAYIAEPFDPERGRHLGAVLRRILSAIGLDKSPFHAEFRHDKDGRLHVLEIAPRLSGGGATAHHLLAICTGLDAYGIHRRLAWGPVDLRPLARAVGLEYDFAPKDSGFLRNIGDVVRFCHRQQAVAVLEHRADGQHVLAPPFNAESVITAFFRQPSVEAARTLFHNIHSNCAIETQA